MSSEGLVRPFKLAVRDRGEWVVAYVCRNVEGGENQPDADEVGRIAKVVAEDRQAFEEWVKALTGWMVRLTQSLSGQEVVKVETIRRRTTDAN